MALAAMACCGRACGWAPALPTRPGAWRRWCCWYRPCRSLSWPWRARCCCLSSQRQHPRCRPSRGSAHGTAALAAGFVGWWRRGGCRPCLPRNSGACAAWAPCCPQAAARPVGVAPLSRPAGRLQPAFHARAAGLVLAHEGVHRRRLDNVWNLPRLRPAGPALVEPGNVVGRAGLPRRPGAGLRCRRAAGPAWRAGFLCRGLADSAWPASPRRPLASRWGGVHPLVERISMLQHVQHSRAARWPSRASACSPRRRRQRACRDEFQPQPPAWCSSSRWSPARGRATRRQAVGNAHHGAAGRRHRDAAVWATPQQPGPDQVQIEIQAERRRKAACC